MIFISTAGFRHKDGFEASKELINSGCTCIELSAGKYRATMVSDLASLRSLAQFKIHNYFPPPEQPFVLNLASLDEDISSLSMQYVMRAISIASELSQPVYSFHAGFLIDPKLDELGRRFKSKVLFDRSEALARFIDRVNKVDQYAQSLGVKILIENNVLSAQNHSEFNGNPFLMASADECLEVMLQTSLNVQLLIDVAHLKVSANSLDFNPVDFLRSNEAWIGAYHLSDNDGTRDSNESIRDDSWFWPYLKRDLDYYSLEIYGVTTSELLRQRDLAMGLLRG